MIKKERCYSTFSEEDKVLVPSIEPQETEKNSPYKPEYPKKKLKPEEKLKMFATKKVKHERDT